MSVWLPVTVFGYDQAEPSAVGIAETKERALQNLRLLEQPLVEKAWAARILEDVDVLASRPTLREAVAYLEGELSKTDTQGYLHLGAQWASIDPLIIFSSGTALRSQLGHKFVFGGGYVEGCEVTFSQHQAPCHAPCTNAYIVTR